MAHYTVKSWSPFFKAIVRGDKLHDLRDLKDRKYKVGDILTLCEYEPFLGTYTGEKVDVEVTYITSTDTPCAFSSSALDSDYAILSIQLTHKVVCSNN